MERFRAKTQRVSRKAVKGTRTQRRNSISSRSFGTKLIARALLLKGKFKIHLAAPGQNQEMMKASIYYLGEMLLVKTPTTAKANAYYYTSALTLFVLFAIVF
jgi:hypothetical protein